MNQAGACLAAFWGRLREFPATLEIDDAEQEQRFQKARIAWLQPRVLPIAILVACVFTTFLLFDRVFAPELLVPLASVRVFTAVLLVGIGLVSRFRPSLVPMNVTTTLIAAIIYTGVFLTHVILGSNSVYRFTEAIMLIQIGTWFLGGMTFPAAAAVNSVALVIYLVLMTLVIKAPPQDVWQCAMYVVALGVIGGFAVYAIERLFRRTFVANELLAAQRLEYRARAMRDGLTGLWNRAAMVERVAAARRSTSTSGLGGAVFMIDLDNFKPVNDLYGHQAGDEVLVAIARRIQSALRPSDSVGRMGGDEFLVLVEDLSEDDMPQQLAERMRSEIESPIRVRMHGDSASVAVAVGASIGMAFFSGEVMPADVLINIADQEMYNDKARRRAQSTQTR